MPVDPSTLDKTLEAIRRAYGENVVRTGAEKPIVTRIPTGSLVLDWATGGGFPLGRWCHFYGGYMSAKTLTAWNMIKSAQDMGLSCAYYNAENQFDPVWAAAKGIDLDKLLVIDRTKIEDIGEALETLLGSVNVHVVDSIGAAVSADELAGDIRDWNPGIAARSWGKALRRANDRFDDEQNTILLINHAKDSFGRMGGEEAGGPKLIRFYSSLDLHFKRSSWLYYDKNGILTTDGEKKNSLTGDIEPDGLEFQVRNAKSRIGGIFRSARFRLDFESGEYDHLWVLARAASFFGVLERKGAWYTLPSGDKVQGENGVRDALMNDADLVKLVTDRVMEDT